jgi:glycosyltransferase involved in cell wall biosynthesis
MHVLIIPGEELNQNNTLSSIFEINQAQALKEMNANVGFISINICGSIYKELIHQLKKLNFSITKCAHLNVTRINETNLVEACGIYITPSFLNLYRKERIHAGLRAFNHYCKEFGRPDIIHAHSRFLDSILIAKKIKDLFGTPYVITEHSTFHQRNIVSKKEYVDYIDAVEHSQKWLVVSETLGNIIKKNIGKLNLKLLKSFIVLPNVVDPSFKFVKKNDNRTFVFLNIASLDEKKNHLLLLDSFKLVTDKYQNIELRIGGQGLLEKKLKIHAKEIGLNNVKFLGSLERHEVKKEFTSSNSFVLSSTAETFGVVILESLAIGRPVVSTICGGPEYIINHSNGILTRSEDKNKLAYAMSMMIDNYSNFDLMAISRNCIENYGTKAIGKKLIEIYQSALT